MNTWPAGIADVTVIMITLNEAHNLEGALESLQGWAKQVIVIDSYSRDSTVDIALKFGVDVVQRRFRSYGDQWNFALTKMPIEAKWTLKLDPDERLSAKLKDEIIEAVSDETVDGFDIEIQLNFMKRTLPVKLRLLRLWRTGKARFSHVEANEHAMVTGSVKLLKANIHHHDSPSLDHWIAKQNRYTTAEAKMLYQNMPLAEAPRLFGNRLQRRMWLKSNFHLLPGRFTLLFLYYLLYEGTWRAGRVGIIWARLRSDVMRLTHYKKLEMDILGGIAEVTPVGFGAPDSRVPQHN